MGKLWLTDYWSGTLILSGPLLRVVKDALRIHSVKRLDEDIFGEQFLVTKPVRDFLHFVLKSAQDYGPTFNKVILEDFIVTDTRTLKSVRRSLEIKILLRLLKPGLEVYVRSALG